MHRIVPAAAVVVVCLCLATISEAQSLGTVKPAGREGTLSIGGLLQVQMDVGDRGDSRFTNDNDRFHLRRARINATGKFLEEFDFRIELDLAGSFSNSAGLRAQMTDGYINWNRYLTANVRAGQFKTPFGFEQLYGDPRLITIERSLANDRLTANRQLGVQVGGDLLPGRLSYAVGAFNGNGANNNFNDDDRFYLAGRVSGVPWQGRLFGQLASWGVGTNAYSSQDGGVPLSDLGLRDGTFSGKREGTGVDSQLVAGRFELWGELLRGHFEPLSKVPSAQFDADGWYGQASYFVVPLRLQFVLKHETFDPNTKRPNDSTDTTTVGGNFYLKGHDLKLMLDYLRTKGPGPVDNQDKVLARLQVIF
jgi:phosphate-selective porin OprO and OprP